MRLVLAVLAFGLMVAPASAASFSCAKAVTPLENAICADAGLSQADEDMARAFTSARQVLSKAALETVRDNQRQWLDHAARACTADAEPMLSGRYDEDGIACLTTIFTNRADALAEIGVTDGLTLYTVDAFSTEKDPDPESWLKVATTEISYVQIDGDDAEARAFNAFAKGLAQTAFAPESDAEAGTTDYGLGVKVKSATDELIVLEVTNYMYGHGAAHGNYAITYAQFLRGESRPLAADEVFVGDDWALEIKPLIIERLKDDAEKVAGDREAIWEDLTDLELSIADPERWDVQKDGIGFQFEPYEVSAYAYGAPQALMSWSELEPWLEPGAQALLIGD